MTDPKGDRSLSPSQQVDPDLFLHIVERRKDGIVVRGAKAHQTGIVNSHEVLVMPTISMTEADKDYAVCFPFLWIQKGLKLFMEDNLVIPENWKKDYWIEEIQNLVDMKL